MGSDNSRLASKVDFKSGFQGCIGEVSYALEYVIVWNFHNAPK